MRTIAVIDDNADLLKAIGSMLEGPDFTVLLFESATVALRAVIDQPVDLILTDIFMPGMDGFRFLEEVRAVLPDVPVIAMSGGGKFSGASVLNDTKDFGATATLAKPFRRPDLLALIEKTLASQP